MIFKTKASEKERALPKTLPSPRRIGDTLHAQLVADRQRSDMLRDEDAAEGRDGKFTIYRKADFDLRVRVKSLAGKAACYTFNVVHRLHRAIRLRYYIGCTVQNVKYVGQYVARRLHPAIRLI